MIKEAVAVVEAVLQGGRKERAGLKPGRYKSDNPKAQDNAKAHQGEYSRSASQPAKRVNLLKE